MSVQRKTVVEPFVDTLKEYQSFLPGCAVRAVCHHGRSWCMRIP